MTNFEFTVWYNLNNQEENCALATVVNEVQRSERNGKVTKAQFDDFK